MTRASEWAERVADWRASGKSAAEYCTGREYSSKTLQWWASRLRRDGRMAARARAGSSASAHSSSPVSAVQLARVVRGPASSMTTRPVVVQVGGARVEVEAGTDRATLALVFEALSMASGASR